jgi:uncharacterized Zn-binding protein involved in type VI secretion
MPSPVAREGSQFTGYCSACDSHVSGLMHSSEHVLIEGLGVCVTGSPGTGYCGHGCVAVGGSAVLSVNGRPVARVGDPVTGTITGTITTGNDFVFSD